MNATRTLEPSPSAPRAAPRTRLAPEREPEAASGLERASGPLVCVLVALAVFGLSYNGGSYEAEARAAVAVAVWWGLALMVGLGLWPRRPVPRVALIAGGLLAAFAAWTGLSALWAPAAETALAELQRALLYLGVFAVGVLAARSRDDDRFSDGLALGIAAVAVLALASRLFPSLTTPDPVLAEALPTDAVRLGYPVGYWNGLALLVALGVPPLLRAATGVRRAPWRALPVAAIPILGAVIYLTSSRGGAAVAVLGGLAFVALTDRRLVALWAAAIGGAGVAGAVLVLHARPVLSDGPLRSSLAHGQGRSAALLIVVICLACAAAYGAVAALTAARSARAPGWARAAALAAVVLAGLVAVVLADPSERFERFKALPDVQAGSGFVESHLLTESGSGRWQFWSAAGDQFTAAPLAGAGAGSYEAHWARSGDAGNFVRDAHSLWVETLGELGVVGFALLAGAFLIAGAAAAARLRGRPREERSAPAALAALLLAFVLAAGIDWMWELTAGAVVGILALALLVGPATLPVTGRAGAARWRGSRPHPPATNGSGAPRTWGTALRVAAVAAALAAIGFAAMPLLGQMQLRSSQAAAGRGDAAESLRHARRAARLEPWASAPPLQAALVEEQAGDLPAARADVDVALDRNPTDWRLWVVSARIAAKLGEPRAAGADFARARMLNPRSPIFYPR